jgi:hypothetical protein
MDVDICYDRIIVSGIKADRCKICGQVIPFGAQRFYDFIGPVELICFIQGEKEWLAGQGNSLISADNLSWMDFRSLRSLYPKLIVNNNLSRDQMEHLRHAILRMGGDCVLEMITPPK